MKKYLAILSCILTVFAILLAGCSKDSPVLSVSKQDANIVKNANVDNNSGRVNPANTGSITGALTPVPLKATLKAYNDHFESEEVVMNPDGTFKISNLPPDGYNLLINYVPENGTDYLIFEVHKITVVANEETKLGNINLPG